MRFKGVASVNSVARRKVFLQLRVDALRNRDQAISGRISKPRSSKIHRIEAAKRLNLTAKLPKRPTKNRHHVTKYVRTGSTSEHYKGLPYFDRSRAKIDFHLRGWLSCFLFRLCDSSGFCLCLLTPVCVKAYQKVVTYST